MSRRLIEPMRLHDVVVVGARCAGAATAMLLAAAGHDVLLVDRDTFPSDTLSTHAIARSGVVQLNRWGLLPDVLATGAPPIREVVFHSGGTSITRTVKERLGVDMLIAPRRHILDSLLVDAAVSAGAQLLTGVTVDGVRRSHTGRVSGVDGRARPPGRSMHPARFVVGADGRGSRIARSVGRRVHRGTRRRQRDALRILRRRLAGDGVPPRRSLFAGVFPTNDGEACVWVCSPADVRTARPHARTRRSTRRSMRWSQAAAPGVGRATRDAGGLARRRSEGSSALPNHLRQPVGPGWALVGDAGYHRDADHGPRHQRRLPRRRTAGDRPRSRASRRCPTRRAPSPATTRRATSSCGRSSRSPASWRPIPPADRFVELQKQLGARDRRRRPRSSPPARCRHLVAA